VLLLSLGSYFHSWHLHRICQVRKMQETKCRRNKQTGSTCKRKGHHQMPTRAMPGMCQHAVCQVVSPVAELITVVDSVCHACKSCQQPHKFILKGQLNAVRIWDGARWLQCLGVYIICSLHHHRAVSVVLSDQISCRAAFVVRAVRSLAVACLCGVRSAL
jgi:hypothetical protein